MKECIAINSLDQLDAYIKIHGPNDLPQIILMGNIIKSPPERFEDYMLLCTVLDKYPDTVCLFGQNELDLIGQRCDPELKKKYIDKCKFIHCDEDTHSVFVNGFLIEHEITALHKFYTHRQHKISFNELVDILNGKMKDPKMHKVILEAAPGLIRDSKVIDVGDRNRLLRSTYNVRFFSKGLYTNMISGAPYETEFGPLPVVLYDEDCHTTSILTTNKGDARVKTTCCDEDYNFSITFPDPEQDVLPAVKAKEINYKEFQFDVKQQKKCLWVSYLASDPDVVFVARRDYWEDEKPDVAFITVSFPNGKQTWAVNYSIPCFEGGGEETPFCAMAKELTKLKFNHDHVGDILRNIVSKLPRESMEEGVEVDLLLAEIGKTFPKPTTMKEVMGKIKSRAPQKKTTP